MMNFNPINFASDNNSGIVPEAVEALVNINSNHTPAYGNESTTQKAIQSIKDLFETDAEVFFVYNGTAANALALAALTQPHQAILGHRISHIDTDECSAAEFFIGGSKILTIEGPNGKLTPEGIRERAKRRTDVHFPTTRTLSLTQATEVGTIYQPKELEAIREVTKELNLNLHMDGARFANAIANLNCSPKEISWKVGVDVLVFGATKNGLPYGEAVVFFNHELAKEFAYRCKQAGQLSSKMRYISAGWNAVLKNDTWLNYARHANSMAQYLAKAIQSINHPGIKILYPTEANGVFLNMPDPIASFLYSNGWQFYYFNDAQAFRLMCSWDSTTTVIDQFIKDLKEGLNANQHPITSFPVQIH